MFKTKNLIGLIFVSLILWTSVSSVDAAKLYFSPSTGSYIYNCPFDVDVMLDMEGQDTTAMDLKIMVNEARYSILDFDGQGGMFRTYTKPKYINVRRWSYQGINNVYVFLSTFAPPAGVQWGGKIWTLTIMPNKWIRELPLNFFWELGSKWEDSNVPVLSGWELVDGLTSIENWYYNLVEGPCDFHLAASWYKVQDSDTPFEIVKNEEIVEGERTTPTMTTNLIKQYGWYLILLIVLLILIVVVKKDNKKKKK